MLMQEPPDPRRFSLSGTQSLPETLRPFVDAGLSQSNRGACLAAIERLLDRRADEEVRSLLAWRGTPALARAFRECVQEAIDGPVDAALRTQIFAIPVVVVAGVQAPAEVAMVLRDVDAVQEIFRATGCLGPSAHFAVHPGLCTAQVLEALSPSDLYMRSRLRNEVHLPMDLPVAPLSIPVPGQSVHLRFLAGTTVVARGAPSFCETAGETGRWGAAFTQEIAGQLRQPGITLLPLARAPQGLYRALTSGRFCREEMAFQLAVSDSLREFRSKVGDPHARLYACGADSAAVDLS
ncbi:MAG: hypothetical protein ACKVQA_20900, partial [Burkholderiales bacterium]